MTVVMAKEYQKQGKREGSEQVKPHDSRLRESGPVWEHIVL